MSPKKQPSLDSEHIARELFEVAELRAKHHGRTLGRGADRDIRGFAESAAAKIVREHAQLDEVRAAFTRVVDEMVIASDEIAGYRKRLPDTIGEETLVRALNKLCPLFPFC